MRYEMYFLDGRKPIPTTRALLDMLEDDGHRIRIVYADRDETTFSITRGDTGRTFTARYSIEDAIFEKGWEIGSDGEPVVPVGSGWSISREVMIRNSAVRVCVVLACPEYQREFCVF